MLPLPNRANSRQKYCLVLTELLAEMAIAGSAVSLSLSLKVSQSDLSHFMSTFPFTLAGRVNVPWLLYVLLGSA